MMNRPVIVNAGCMVYYGGDREDAKNDEDDGDESSTVAMFCSDGSSGGPLVSMERCETTLPEAK